MKFENKLLSFFKKKYGKKVTLNSNLFLDLNVDSFELVKLVFDIEKNFKKKYSPGNFLGFDNLDIKKFAKLFK
jgi:acyl carrier protein|tara:strand:+ start:193 stop:411 length:219 start_codon:yes stop_codon:yes gene_type:complete